MRPSNLLKVGDELANSFRNSHWIKLMVVDEYAEAELIIEQVHLA